MTLKISPMLGIVLITGSIVSACSSQVQNEPLASVASTPVASSKPVVDALAHTHPANECTNSITHTHPNGDNQHEHNYQCSPKAIATDSGAHTHPANELTRSISHSHPNGKNDHQHRYGGQKPSVNNAGGEGHVHPANSLTLSTRHSHPNGQSAHSHSYSK